MDPVEQWKVEVRGVVVTEFPGGSPLLVAQSEAVRPRWARANQMTLGVGRSSCQCVIWVCLLPCRHPRATNDRRRNGSNKSFALCSHLRVATWMCRMPNTQAPMFRRLTLRSSRLRPEKTLHLTGQQIAQDQVSRSVSFV